MSAADDPADIVIVSHDGPVRLPGAAQVLDQEATIRRQAEVIRGLRNRVRGNLEVIDNQKRTIAAFSRREGEAT